MGTGIGEYIKKLIELSSIKKEYFEDIIDGRIVEDNKTKRIILSLDEEFMECLGELKRSESIESLGDLDVSRNPMLLDLRNLVEELFQMEELIVKKRNVRKVIVK